METNLFSDDVVIIIGAGASVPFGLPTGLGLIDLVANGLREEVKDFDLLQSMNNLRLTPITHKCFHPQMAERHRNRNYYCTELEGREFWLNSQVSDSIDDLVRLNLGEAKWLKFCMAYEILKCTHNTILNSELKGQYLYNEDIMKTYFVRKHEKRIIEQPNGKKIRNWIHNLINIVRDLFVKNWKDSEGYRNSNELKTKTNHKIKIISFNYDGLLEHILIKCWHATEVNFPEWNEVFEIVHPHGWIEIEEEVGCDCLADYLENSSKKIVVVKEPIYDGSEDFSDVIAWRTRAKEMIVNASQVMAIGFAFAKSNCDLIGLEKGWLRGLREDNKKIHFINFDDNFGLRERVRSIREYNSPLLSGSGAPIDYDHGLSEMKPLKGDYLQITDALMGGFLGEMPS